MKNYNSLIISNINKLLKQKKITQKDLAEGIDVTRTTINNWLNKRSKIDGVSLKLISMYLGVPVGYFFEEGETGDNITNNNNVINNVRNGNGKQTLIIGQKDNEIEGLQKEVQVLKEQISELKTIIGQKDQMIEQLMTIHRGE